MSMKLLIYLIWGISMLIAGVLCEKANVLPPIIHNSLEFIGIFISTAIVFKYIGFAEWLPIC